VSLRILHAVSSNLASPWLSAHAANVAWLPGALRDRGHDVTVRIIDPATAGPATLGAEGFDVVHIHDIGDAPLPALAHQRNVLVTGYASGARAAGLPWIALSTMQERQAGVPALAVFPPAIDTAAVPAVFDRSDALAFGFDGHDDYALGAAISIAAHAERPLDVVMPAHVVVGEACSGRLADAQSSGFVRVHRVARNEFPMPIANAAAYLALCRTPFDMGALSAMATGTPVVTFSGMPAAGVIVGGESGFVCERPEEAARVLERLDLLRPALGRSRASIVFDTAAAAMRHEALYERMLAGEIVSRFGPRVPAHAVQLPAAGSREEVAVA